MFNAPDVYTNIPDIAQMYEINEAQCFRLEREIDEMDNNIFLEKMNEHTIRRWERILKINPLDTDTVEDRRFRVKSKVIEKLPYSHKVILRKLDALCPLGYVFTISEDRTSVLVKLALKSKNMMADVSELLEEVLPLNMTYSVTVMWNNYEALSKFTHGELAESTHQQLREDVR